MREMARRFWRSGEPWIWLNAGAVAVSLLVVFGLIGLIAMRGLGHFWPSDVWSVTLLGEAGDDREVIGVIAGEERVSLRRFLEAEDVDALAGLPEGVREVPRVLFHTGNRDVQPPDFRWIYEHRIAATERPRDVVHLERTEWGDAFGFLTEVRQAGAVVAEGDAAWPAFRERLARVQALRTRARSLERGPIAEVGDALEQLRLAERELTLTAEGGRPDPAAIAARSATITERRAVLERRHAALTAELDDLLAATRRDTAVFRLQQGRTLTLPLAEVIRAWRPNAMGPLEKTGFYLRSLWSFLSEGPRAANAEGGIYPAIFGTVLMVLLMSVMVTPFGVIAAVYLREYARQGVVVRLVRIAVNNLAGVPSIVYGVFGLGFFVYFVGGGLDAVFYDERLPSPTFGTPGLLWASLTLALLTVPVVIVSTEEGLARIPRSLREGSMALGATRAETLWRVILPMASPSIMTGVILAVARAAGEVAPLMLVGVVKLAPELPVDGDFPYVHLERKFMHLGFHIYDLGFQSPNAEAARPLVYATALLLVLIIVLLNLTAILLRNRLRRRYGGAEG